MRAAALLLLASSACSQIFGLDSPQGVIPGDAPRMDGIADTAAIDASGDGAVAVTVSFQQGSNAYASAQDTWLDGVNPNQTRDGDTQLRWNDTLRSALIQYNAIFGSTAGRIPQQATIQSASLSIFMSQANCTGSVREVAIGWVDTVTYNTFGALAGVDMSDLGPVVNPTPTVTNQSSIDVTSSLVKWRADPTTNNGWIFVGTGGGGDCVARSSEDGTVANRPMLTVTYLP
ncbi:MAG TPA: DNRLRE domain-containing protein [Kofleriaceae bacterium]|nr:DNRLRE domain-containing protein [Kofleriaceae bacterium]